MNSYLGVDISSLPDNKGFTLSEIFLIDRVVQALNFDHKTPKSAKNNTPAGCSLLKKDDNGPVRKASWKYRGIISMLGYLQGTTRPDIAMSTHQYARFNNYPHLSHERAISVLADIYWILGTRE